MNSNNENLPETLIGEELIKLKQTISTAESCTGGNIAHHLSRFAGSSAFFYGGVVAYDNSIKERVLQVKTSDLINYGAVSQQVVEQMAVGVRDLMKTDWAVATSGIAGPTGGSVDKPVGTVWIAWAGPNGVISELFHFGDSRAENIKAATESGLLGVFKLIKMENNNE